MKRYAVTAMALAAISVAQEPPDRIKNVEVFTQAVAAPTHDVLHFVSSEFSWEDKIVKNAPYSADAVTETTQVLADGNRINRKNNSRIFRDSEGRTRREQTLDHVGPWASGAPLQTVFINDPVAGVNYVLEDGPNARTARKHSAGKPRVAGEAGFGVRGGTFSAAIPGPGMRIAGPRVMIAGGAPGAMFVDGSMKSKDESLGKRMIEGVEAEGTRSTLTIPAGQIGNDRPIEIVSERWYSPELQTVVLTKRNDPQFGETHYRLANIQRGEPNRSLFEPPADYTVKEGFNESEEESGPGVIKYRRRKE